MRVTVAICTYNRANDAVEAVRSLVRQDYPRDEFEIVVIDNNSKDHTREIILRAADEHEGYTIRYVLEEKQGLSVARNRAIREASGKYILFLDDDAIACRDWIKQIVSVFEMDKRIGCVGGKIDPIWEVPEPMWIPRENRSLFTILDFSDEVTEMESPYIPFGANVAFRVSVFEEMAPFREDLGRVGNNLLSSEESELIGRIRTKYKIYYTPYGAVEHKVAKERTTKNWFLRRIYWQGVSDAIRDQDRGPVRTAKHGIKLAQGITTALIYIFNTDRFTRQLAKVCYRNGMIVGSLRQNSKG
ncbi:glycosyltransferase [Paenibacillus sp. CC-CFT742]|uniref:glycosyltransferase n=1 Tax=Paenibacillus illinoisensis TaxID=59845 RepID=UPI002574B46A|nr:glycosyltransferase [Paenibacillus sp. CC-CFT742]WJH30915.1 glycosyltransferase [Paenibacillus sp. CC-CFT742]